MRRSAFAIAFILAWSGCTCASDIAIAPPRVPQGGRAVAIAVSQSDNKRIVVASETGGLFRTFDGGVSFHHLDAFPTFAPVDVAIASLDPNVVIATARDDFRTTSAGGIWRSTDGGATWKRPVGWPPTATSPTCFGRPAAYGISHMPLTRTFYVATDCGLAVSNDDGATFSIVVPDPLELRVRAVQVLNRSVGVVATDSRLFFLRGGQWVPATGGPVDGGTFSTHAFASPWWATSSTFYHTGRDRELYISTDTGATWTLMETPPGRGPREPFVRVGRGLDGDPSHFDVYFGTGFTYWRQAVTTVLPAGNNNAWREPDETGHRDPSVVAFTSGHTNPLMLASDGGVHLTIDNGRNWKLTGSGYGGFTALQIVEMTGRAVGGDKPHQDLYYSTQDNDIKGSQDGGKTWDGSICCEGAFLGADAANPARIDGPVTGRTCGGCMNFVVPPHVGSTNDPPPFRNAPDGSPASRADPPAQLIGSTYLQGVRTMGPTPTFDFFLTHDLGETWAPAFSLPFAPQGAAQFSGNRENPIAYIGVERSGAFGLFRVSDVTAQASVRRADSIGFYGFGALATGQSKQVVFGVDPANANHLIAPDVYHWEMKASADGGLHWFLLPRLTMAVRDTGRFGMSMGGASFVTTVAWDPTNSCHILVGTMQNGVVRSADGGQTWARVAGSPVATYITSFYFPPSGSIWMSTYGRGLWTLKVDRSPPASGRCDFPVPPGIVAQIDTLEVVARSGGPARPFGGLSDPAVCPTCSIVAVRGGWITDLTTDGNTVTAVAIASGFIEQRNRQGLDVPLSLTNSYAAEETPALRRLADGSLTRSHRVRALVLNGSRLDAVVIGTREPMPPLPGSRTPMVVVQSAGRSRIPSIGESGDSVAVHGYGFIAGSGAAGVSIVLGTDTVARGVGVGRDGRFSVRLPLNAGVGILSVTAAQRDGRRLTIGQASLSVVGRD